MTPPKKRHTVTINDMDFQQRRQAVLSHAVVEFTMEELAEMGAVLDDDPMTEEDYEVEHGQE